MRRKFRSCNIQLTTNSIWSNRALIRRIWRQKYAGTPTVARKRVKPASHADVEPDQKGPDPAVPEAGAKFLSFNVDPQFSDSLDGLIVVDLAQTEARVLER
jgi:hypothetical protein